MIPKSFCRVGPSILNANLARLSDECRRLLDAGADYLHLDVMDGHFVPNLTFGAPVVKALREDLDSIQQQPSSASSAAATATGTEEEKTSSSSSSSQETGNPDSVLRRMDDDRRHLGPYRGVFFETHMMVSEPSRWIPDMAAAGVQQYTFHLEAAQEDPRPVIRAIRDAGMLVGLAINPSTDVSYLIPYAELVDTLLIMTVVPGFGGQSFIRDCLPKIRTLRSLYPEKHIEVDGGLNLETVDEAAAAGANLIVAGSAVIRSEDPKQVMDELRRKTVSWHEKRIAESSSASAPAPAEDGNEDGKKKNGGNEE